MSLVWYTGRMSLIFYFLVLVFSVIIHEVAHGYAAKIQGDDTAEVMGRLTINPIPHIDPFGSVILPLFLIIISSLTGGSLFLFGWAKPVPYNPLKLKDLRWGQFWVAIAGAAANFCLAILFALLVRFGIGAGGPVSLVMFPTIILTNLMLGVFNLMPVPPLDGSKVLAGLLGERWAGAERFLMSNSLVVLLVFMMFGSYLIMPIISFLYKILLGV